MRLTIAQLDTTVGDFSGNIKKATDVLSRFARNSDIVVFPEMFITGYPLGELPERQWFIEKSQAAIEELKSISRSCPDTGILVGAPLPSENGENRLYNAALLIQNGRIIFWQAKSALSCGGLLDEARQFDPADSVSAFPFKGEMLGVSIGEHPPVEQLAKNGTTLFINLCASPFSVGREGIRFEAITRWAKRYSVPFVYVNSIGGNDELIFDGRSLFVDKNGSPVHIFPAFEEFVETIDTDLSGAQEEYIPQDEIESVHNALVLGLRDYVRKCGFEKVVVGLSGGVDSSVVAALAAEAIGAENVLGLAMPSCYSSPESEKYARHLAGNLGVNFAVIPISDIYESYKISLKEELSLGDEVSLTLENIQARIRGNILMAFSNRFGYLVLSSGNRSEAAVGYCTLYGDMVGGLAVISDVPKTMVYKLAHYINRKREVIPSEIISRVPSAELRPGQIDQDTLPPYDILDRILSYYLDEKKSVDEIVRLGFDRETVLWVAKAVKRSEFKRRQAPPGLRIRLPGLERVPIASKWEC